MNRTVRWQLLLNAPPDRVYLALDDSNERARYWAESAKEVGGRIEFRFKGEVNEVSEVVRRIENRFWSIRYFGCLLEIELADTEDGGTELCLTHHDVRADDYIETYAGWLNVLLPLKAWVQNHVELRNRDPERSWSRGYADG